MTIDKIGYQWLWLIAIVQCRLTAPAVAATTKHVVKKVDAPAQKDASVTAAAPGEAASKPAHVAKNAHKATPAKKSDVATPAVK